MNTETPIATDRIFSITWPQFQRLLSETEITCNNELSFHNALIDFYRCSIRSVYNGRDITHFDGITIQEYISMFNPERCFNKYATTPPADTTGEGVEDFLSVLNENMQAQVTGKMYDKTKEDKQIRNAVIQEYKDLISIYSRNFYAKQKALQQSHAELLLAAKGAVNFINESEDGKAIKEYLQHTIANAEKLK